MMNLQILLDIDEFESVTDIYSLYLQRPKYTEFIHTDYMFGTMCNHGKIDLFHVSLRRIDHIFSSNDWKEESDGISIFNSTKNTHTIYLSNNLFKSEQHLLHGITHEFSHVIADSIGIIPQTIKNIPQLYYALHELFAHIFQVYLMKRYFSIEEWLLHRIESALKYFTSIYIEFKKYNTIYHCFLEENMIQLQSLFYQLNDLYSDICAI